MPSLDWSQLDDRLDRARRARKRAPLAAPLTRVVWQLAEHRDGRISVLPLEQTERPKGGFTPGRKLSRGEFLSRTPEPGRADLAALVRLLAKQWSRWRRRSSAIRNPRAILAIAGSPHVAWKKGKRKVEVVALEACLVVAIEEAGYSVQLRIEAADELGLDGFEPLGEGVFVLREGRKRLSVFAIDEGLAPIFPELAEAPVQVPSEAAEALFEHLSGLEGRVKIELPQELQGPPLPNPRPHLFLSRDGRRFQAELRLKSDEESPRRPGEPRSLWVGGQRRQSLGGDELERCTALMRRIALVGPGAEAPSDWSWPLDLPATARLLGKLAGLEATELVVDWPAEQSLRLTRPAELADLSLELEEDHRGLVIQGFFELDGDRISLDDTLGALGDGELLVALDSERILQLSRELRALLEKLALRKKGKAPPILPAALVPQFAPMFEAAKLCSGAEVWAGWEARLASARAADGEPSAGLKAELRSYQKEGVQWLRRLAAWGVGAVLADDMGLGKTVQSIALLLDRAALGPTLVVAPTSVGPGWLRELGRFAPSLRARDYRDERAGGLASLAPGEVLVLSYELMRLDIDALAEIDFATVVFDEAQRLKNAHTQTAVAARRLRSAWSLALSGTPIENHLGELWSIVSMVAPGVLGTRSEFRENYLEPIERRGDPLARAELAQLIRPYVLRRHKEDVLEDLPPRTDLRIDVELDPEERRLYEAHARLLLQELEDGERPEEQRRLRVLAALTRLRQIACHPGLVDASWSSSSKLEALAELVEELRDGGHRMLLFSQFTRFLDRIQDELEAREIELLRLDGSTPARHRGKLVDQFQGSPPGSVFLISLKAGGQGLNLTAADVVIHADPWWNPAVEDQASDRAHRIGQTRPVTVIRVVATRTIEEVVLELHERKREITDALLAGADQAGRLDTEALIGLIRESSES